jgi:hypothetical protein
MNNVPISRDTSVRAHPPTGEEITRTTHMVDLYMVDLPMQRDWTTSDPNTPQTQIIDATNAEMISIGPEIALRSRETLSTLQMKNHSMKNQLKAQTVELPT